MTTFLADPLVPWVLLSILGVAACALLLLAFDKEPAQ